MIDRRAFIAGVTLGFLAAPLAPEAQPARKVHRIGVIVPVEPASPTEPNVAAFREGLRSLGHVEGQNIVVEYRYAHGEEDAYAEAASEFVRLKVDIMVVGSWQPALAAKKLTQTIPIVGVGMGADPVRLGVVASLSRPGGNVTGSSWLAGKELGGKWVELLKQAAPQIVRVGYLGDPRVQPNQSLTLETAKAAADTLGLALQVFQAREVDEVATILAHLSKERGSGLVVQSSLSFMAHASEITKLIAKHRLPAIYAARFFMDAGGLMSYGPSLSDLWRRAAIHVDKILKGTKPADLPVERPTTFELVINLKTAKALGLTIPQLLLLRADAVIQ
jgi:putative ABC transport system substrate-binding protein